MKTKEDLDPQMINLKKFLSENTLRLSSMGDFVFFNTKVAYIFGRLTS